MLEDWGWPYQRVNFFGSLEYACPHGIGHGGVHGCDGCCSHPSYARKNPAVTKLLFCPACQDVVRLMAYMRYCHCELSYGYMESPVYAAIGGRAMLIGLENNSFYQQVIAKPKEPFTGDFTAFIIEDPCIVVRKIRRVKGGECGEDKRTNSKQAKQKTKQNKVRKPTSSRTKKRK